MMDSITYTHSGWFWFCPILWAEDGPDSCCVEARWWWLEPLFTACEVLERLRIGVSCLLWPDYEPEFGFHVRPLETPITLIRKVVE